MSLNINAKSCRVGKFKNLPNAFLVVKKISYQEEKGTVFAIAIVLTIRNASRIILKT